jgi:hypothetical protein
MKPINKLSLLASLCLLSTNCVHAADDARWKFTIAPYIWATAMNGEIQIANQPAYVSQTFSDLMKNFKGGGMLWLDASKGKFGLFANVLYSALGENTNVDTFTIKSTADYGLLSIGASYRIFERKYNGYSMLAIDPYIGARYTIDKASIKILNTNIYAKRHVDWVDPIIGARLLYNLNKHWSANAAADIGGTNFNNHKSYDLYGLIGYNPSNTSDLFTLYLGYRLLYQHYATGSGIDLFVWKMHLAGPVLGFAFRF